MMGVPGLDFERSDDGVLRVRLSGSWELAQGVPPASDVVRAAESGPLPRRVAFEAAGLDVWDTSLLAFLQRASEELASRGLEVDRSDLPPGMRRLLEMAVEGEESSEARGPGRPGSLLARVGGAALAARDGLRELVAFVGECALACGRLVVGRARFRPVDLWLVLQQCGADALPIVSLVCFLVGLILAFVGAVQLRQFGAEIFVADLVALGMTREMGAMMTAIIMAGRTGAAFAAQLGTMTVNEEIDALRTLGISPIEFLVLPRMLALVVMMPLLSLYADLLGMLGGAVVGVGMLDLGAAQYYEETRYFVGLDSFGWGLLKAVVYGTLVALAGCLRGMQCGRSAAAVGSAATSAVVTAIVWIVVASGILNLLDNVLQG